MLRSINEGGRFTKPNNIEDSGLLSKKLAEYDNDLFRTARLITCGLYLNIILKEYSRTILNLNRTDNDFSLDPRKVAGNGVLSQPKHVSPGNVVAAEYNLVYRWHSAISPKDQKLAEERWRTPFGDKDPLEVPILEMLQEFGKLENGLSDDPVSRDIAGLTRGTDKKYDNKALLELLTASVEDAAGSFGANRVPEILRSMEICGIIFARSWNLAGLNDFREHYGLERYGSFDAINKDPAVAAALKDLYKHPNNVELYPGLVIEDTKMSKHPGSGLCLPFTASRALLSDLVNLVGSDRFYTVSLVLPPNLTLPSLLTIPKTDYTPYALTNWGYTEVESDPKVDNGHVLHKLITTAFPGLIKNNSVYAHFLFVTPAENSKILSELGVHGQYDWEKP